MRPKTKVLVCLTDFGRDYKPSIGRMDQRADLPLQGVWKAVRAPAAGPSASEVLP